MREIHALVLELNVLLGVWLALGILQRDRRTPGRRSLALLTLAASLWCAGDLFAERQILGPWAALQVRFLGVSMLTPLWVGVAAQLARLPIAHRLPWFPIALMVPELFLWTLLFFQPWSDLYLVGWRTPGPLWWVHLGYAYTLVALGAAIYVRAGLAARIPGKRWRSLALGASVLLPLATHVAYFVFRVNWPFDPTSALFGPAALALRSAAFSGGFLDVIPVSQRDLIDHLPLGVVVADRKGTIVDLNRRAEALLKTTRHDAIGRALEAVLETAPAPLSIEWIDVRRRGRAVARLACLEPRRRDAAVATNAPPAAA